MNLTSWLGIDFVVLLVLFGAVALGATLKNISKSDMDDASKSKWGLLIGLSPGAGLYAWHKKDELMGHAGEVDEPLN